MGELLAGMVSEIIESIYKSTIAQSQHLVCSYVQIVTPIYRIECATIYIATSCNIFYECYRVLILHTYISTHCISSKSV